MRYTVHLEGPAPSIVAIPGWLTLPGLIRTEPVTVEVADRDELDRDVFEILSRHPEYTRAVVQKARA